MRSLELGPVSLTTQTENWPFKQPFRITGRTWNALELLHVTVEKDGCQGHGEAAGVYFRNETAMSMTRQVEALRVAIETGVSRNALQHMLPPGGARNALDCALWDLEAKLSGRPVWQLASSAYHGL
jgi:L-alanine-DL-glutamate epimerase-like enolase superfamily enzyme